MSSQTIEPTTTVDDPAARAFSISILISAVRCLLSYIVFPWVLPAADQASGWGPGIGLVVGTVALISNGLSIRRFHVSRHRWRWPITALNVSVIVLVTILVIDDLRELLA